MEDKLIIPLWMADYIKMHLLFPSNLFWALDETFGKDQWKFTELPTRKEIENAPSCFVKGWMDDGQKE